MEQAVSKQAEVVDSTIRIGVDPDGQPIKRVGEIHDQRRTLHNSRHRPPLSYSNTSVSFAFARQLWLPRHLDIAASMAIPGSHLSKYSYNLRPQLELSPPHQILRPRGHEYDLPPLPTRSMPDHPSPTLLAAGSLLSHVQKPMNSRPHWLDRKANKSRSRDYQTG